MDHSWVPGGDRTRKVCYVAPRRSRVRHLSGEGAWPTVRHIRQPEPFAGTRQPTRLPSWWQRNGFQALGVTTGGVVTAVVLLMVFPVLPSQRTVTPRPALPAAALSASPVPSPSATPAVQKVRIGVLEESPARVRAYEVWLGRKMRDVVHFSQRDTWAQIARPDLGSWDPDRYRLLYAVPMLPNSEADTKLASMRAGAQGRYDAYFRSVGQALVAAGHEDAVLRIGWEFNVETWPWGIKDDATFRAFFRRVVTAMRSVPGQQFEVNWNVNNGFNPYDGVKYYPGDRYVDTVGVDAYDLDVNNYPYPKGCSTVCRQERQRAAWDGAIYGGPRGLGFWAEFAREHGKPLTLPEWGLWDFPDGYGGGDNTLFITEMHNFIYSPRNNVAAAAYFQVNGADGDHDVITAFPVAGRTFRALFGGR